MQTSEARRGAIMSALTAFPVDGEVTDIWQWTDGHINLTYRLTVREAGASRRYVLQKVNGRVFKDLPGLMENAIRVSEHAVAKLRAVPGADSDAIERGAIRFLRTRAGEPFQPDRSGDVWRIYPCIERASAQTVASSPDEAYEAARAFGRFQGLVADLGGRRLNETMPGFHDTPRRFANLETAARSDTRNRLRDVLDELRACEARRSKGSILQDAFAAGAFPERVVHNDAKFSNVLLDDVSRRAVCVIDLDTVMPGYALHDFGDLVRSICNPAEEGERDLSKVEVRLPFFEALVAGYLDAAAGMLTPAEVALLPDAGWVLTIELVTRFLADYLNGDVYFRVRHPEENLERARAQLTLARRLEETMPEMRACVDRQAAVRKTRSSAIGL